VDNPVASSVESTVASSKDEGVKLLDQRLQTAIQSTKRPTWIGQSRRSNDRLGSAKSGRSCTNAASRLASRD